MKHTYAKPKMKKNVCAWNGHSYRISPVMMVSRSGYINRCFKGLKLWECGNGEEWMSNNNMY